MDNKDAGYQLFLQGWDQKHIAGALKVSEKTVSMWKRKEKWEQKRTEQALAKETAEEKLWALINYQLTALERKTKEWVEGEEYRLLDKGDIDALSKMYSSVKGKQHTWAQVVNIITDFVEFAQSQNFKMAKELLAISDIFLMNKKAAING